MCKSNYFFFKSIQWNGQLLSVNARSVRCHCNRLCRIVYASIYLSDVAQHRILTRYQKSMTKDKVESETIGRIRSCDVLKLSLNFMEKYNIMLTLFTPTCTKECFLKIIKNYALEFDEKPGLCISQKCYYLIDLNVEKRRVTTSVLLPLNM